MRARLLSTLVILVVAACAREAGLPKLYPVPDATLRTHLNETISLSRLRGNVVIFDFIFTRCAGTCPVMSREMKEITERMSNEPDLRFVSISVDPGHDTPDVLRRYKERYSDDSRWLFLTGDRDRIIDVSIRGFKLAAGEESENVVEPLLHSSKFVLVDDEGIIRGYYDTFLEGDLEKLERDARLLLED